MTTSETIVPKYSINRQNALNARKLAGANTSRLTDSVLAYISEKADKNGKNIPTDKFKYAILWLDNIPRSKSQKDIEDALRSLTKNVSVSGSNLGLKSAIAMSIADMKYAYDNSSIFPSAQSARSSLMDNLNTYEVSINKQNLSGLSNKDILNANIRNLNVAMARLGCIDYNGQAAASVRNNLINQTKVIPVESICADLIASGIDPNPARSLVIATMAMKSLGTLWPVKLAWPAFPYGTGTGPVRGSDYGQGLGSILDDVKNYLSTDSSSSNTSSSGTSSGSSELLTKAAGDLVNIYQTNKAADVKQMELDYQLKIAQETAKANNSPTSAVTQDQMLQWMAANKAQTDSLLKQVAQSNNVTIPKTSNTPLYVVGAIGGVALIAMAFALAFSKRPQHVAA